MVGEDCTHAMEVASRTGPSCGGLGGFRVYRCSVSRFRFIRPKRVFKLSGHVVRVLVGEDCTHAMEVASRRTGPSCDGLGGFVPHLHGSLLVSHTQSSLGPHHTTRAGLALPPG